MATLIPSSNISNEELFAVNGQLPPERIEQLLDERNEIIGLHDKITLSDNLRDAMANIAKAQDEMLRMVTKARGANKRSLDVLQHFIENVATSIEDAQQLID